MEIFTIGFTRRSAENFFDVLARAGIERLVDVRVNNTSQLSAFTKRDDLDYFLGRILRAEYVHEPLLAPSKDLLKSYRNGGLSWENYETEFLGLLRERSVEHEISRRLFRGPTVLMCSEPGPERCHRRLIIEYLDRVWNNVQGIHL